MRVKKWDTAANEPEVVGIGTWSHGSEQASYQQFSIPVTYSSCEMPDTVLISIYGGSPDTSAIGTELFIDSLRLDTIGPQEKLAPIANDDDTSTLVGNPVTIDVLTNDEDCDDANPGTPTIVNGAYSGSVSVNSNNTITYFPGSDPDSIVPTNELYYMLNNGQNADTARVRIYVNKNAPEALDDTITVMQDSTVKVNVLNNDTEPDFNQLSVESIVTSPGHGNVQITARDTISYTASETFSGVDSFAYVVCDQISTPLCDTAHVRTDVIAGIGDSKASATFSLYPNPASSQIHLTIDKGQVQQKDLSLTLFTTSGQIARRFPVEQQSNSFRVQDLPGGLYFYNISRANGRKIKQGKVMIMD